MKKIILIPALLVMFLATNAQQDSILKSKKGKIILPEKHDFGVGISANTFFNYLGNFFNQAGTNVLNLGLMGGNNLYGKFFLDKKNVIRLRAFYSTNKENYENKLPNDLDPTGASTVSDQLKSQNYQYSFSLGYERRHGANRLQIYSGAELFVSQYYYNSVYNYGNVMSFNNFQPTSTISFNNGNTQTQRSSYRLLNSKSDNGLGYGARAYFGLEYFIFPKVSIGGEFGVSGIIQDNRKFSNTYEKWDFNTQKKQIEKFDATSNRVGSNTDNLNGQIMLLFYFN